MVAFIEQKPVRKQKKERQQQRKGKRLRKVILCKQRLKIRDYYEKKEMQFAQQKEMSTVTNQSKFKSLLSREMTLQT